MRALTLTQPWASLVALGHKRLETRSWNTDYRGPLLIHAGKGLRPVGGHRGLEDLCSTEPFSTVLAPPHFGDPDLPLGCFVAICQVTNTMQTHYVSALHGAKYERDFGDYGPGRWAWELSDVRRIQPVVANGALGLWHAALDWRGYPMGPETRVVAAPAGYCEEEGVGRVLKVEPQQEDGGHAHALILVEWPSGEEYHHAAYVDGGWQTSDLEVN